MNKALDMGLAMQYIGNKRPSCAQRKRKPASRKVRGLFAFTQAGNRCHSVHSAFFRFRGAIPYTATRKASTRLIQALQRVFMAKWYLPLPLNAKGCCRASTSLTEALPI